MDNNKINKAFDIVTNRVVQEHKKELDDIFYGNQFLMKSFPRFLKKVRSIRFDIPYSALKFYYDNQAIVQIFSPVEEIDYSHIPILSYAPFEKVYADTMYITNDKSTIGIVNFIDLFSKYAGCKMFVLGENVSNLSSDKTLEAFKEYKKDYPIKNIFTDDGKEYLGSFHKYMLDNHINQIFSGANNKTAMSPIERFNKTMRLSIEKYKITYGRITPKVLQVIVDSYNNNIHSNLKYTPQEILSHKNYQMEIQKTYLSRKKEYVHSEEELSGWVRTLNPTNAFSKVKPIWSSKIYEIDFFDPIKRRYQLVGLDKYFNRNQLLPINKKYLMSHKVILQREPRVEKRVLRSTTQGQKIKTRSSTVV